MSAKRTIGILLLLTALAVGSSAILITASSADQNSGYRFTMTMANPGQDNVTFSGSALGGDLSLKSKIGAIETIDLMSGGKLYILTPAIQTARGLDNPAPPSSDSSGWPSWLIEPARVHPLTFAGIIGQQSDVKGEVLFGSDGKISANFESGRLVLLKFPSPSGKGTVTYTYSDFKEDKALQASEFEVPANYQKSK
jgi:hypothetical protein